MYSYDLKITSKQDWQAIANLGVSSQLQLVYSTSKGPQPTLRCRFGATSNSAGFNLRVDDMVYFDSTLYVKPVGSSREVEESTYTVNVTVYE